MIFSLRSELCGGSRLKVRIRTFQQGRRVAIDAAAIKQATCSLKSFNLNGLLSEAKYTGYQRPGLFNTIQFQNRVRSSTWSHSSWSPDSEEILSNHTVAGSRQGFVPGSEQVGYNDRPFQICFS
jgi:hypothetical protein